MCRNKNQGFTLVEMLIVIGIISILARIALPAYTDYIARGKLTEAQVALASYRTSMEQYYQDMRTYALSGAATTCGVTIVNYASSNFSLSCAVSGTGAAQSYVARASNLVNKGLGSAGDYVYTIDDNNLRMTTRFKGVSVTAASGTGCWLTKRGQSC